MKEQEILEMEARLWAYIDGHTLPAEAAAVEQLIQTQQIWREKYQSLIQLHQDIGSHLELEEPSMRFTQNVMEEIARQHIAPATRAYINNKIIYGIAGFFITTIVGFVVFALSRVNWTAPDQSSTGIDWKALNISSFTNSGFLTIFMLVNIVLGLMLLDRYLSQQKKRWKDQV